MDINKSQTIEICKIAWRAGKKILDIYSKKFKIFRKKDKSPVTLADLESEKTIIKSINGIEFKTWSLVFNFCFGLRGPLLFLIESSEFTATINFEQFCFAC